MGLTKSSTGSSALDHGLNIIKLNKEDKIIALAGNPNVGKSTVFNSLTGLNQHTGNWPGKTVANAYGNYVHNGMNFILVDIPGTYSLMSNSVEEEVARDFICFGTPDTTVVVVDATCLERNLNLVLQTMEITSKVIVCVNLLDEAKRKGIHVNLDKLSTLLGVPVTGTSAIKKRGLEDLTDKIHNLSFSQLPTEFFKVNYCQDIEHCISILLPVLEEFTVSKLKARWVAIKLLEGDEKLISSIDDYLHCNLKENQYLNTKLLEARDYLKSKNMGQDDFRDHIVTALIKNSESISTEVVSVDTENYNTRDRKIDKYLTSKKTGIPIMILLLCCVLWITITGANIPSEMLSKTFFFIEDKLTDFFICIGAPSWLHGVLVLGIYRTLAWVVAVMLPPMAIFFPLFTLLEDLGYLPRIAFNLDNYFKKCCACGKQALTMCMGFGCNAAGIVGCRIIDSPRERLIAIITNNFVPCNGRFPTLIAIITMFFAGMFTGGLQSLVSTLILTSVILLGIFMTFFISKLLSLTLLKGIPSNFTLELPPYRKPQLGKIMVHSIFDRTLFVLGRAVSVAAPAGLIIWIMANVYVGDCSILTHCATFLDPFATLIGMDGYILMAFILGFPANEIVVPIIIMSYMSTGTLVDFTSLTQLRELLVSHGWTWLTAVCVMLFSLMHWPCATTCLTIKKETLSLKWTAISFLVPTITGIIVCFIVASVGRLFI